MKPKVFLTGSTGYVGTKFTELYGSRFEIYGISRTDPDHPIDLLDFEALKKAFKDFEPDFIIHLAADLNRDVSPGKQITITTPAITQSLIDLALTKDTPFILASTEAVYGAKENEGGYVEDDKPAPRNPHGVSKLASEKLLRASGLPYLITRGHRHVGISKNFHRPKQFSDTLSQLTDGQAVHLDSRKLFTPVLINNVCDIYVHYLTHDAKNQRLLNIGVDKPITFYDFMVDITKTLGLDDSLVKPDGEEAGWPANSSLSIQKMQKLGYPNVTYEQMLDTIKSDLS